MSETSSVRMADASSAKKRKVKAAANVSSPPAEAQVNGNAESASDNHHVRELQKQLRNVNKKLQAVTKTEAIVNEFKDLSLDQLVAQKKINNDQKAQIVKKSSLEEQRTQIENQIKIIEDVQQDLEAKHIEEKQALAKEHEDEIEKLRGEASEDSTKAASSKVREALHITCKFLHAAAFQRQREDVDELESKAYEAVLFHLYQGNTAAIDTITNVIEGSNDKITEASGEQLDFTFAQLKSSALATENDDHPEGQEESQAAPEQPASDPTIANAGLTELEDTAALTVTSPENATTADAPLAVPEQSSTTAEAANAVAENWAPEASMTTDNTQGDDWVQVPRDPAETETGSSVPAPQQSTSNWADEAGAAAEEQGIVTPVNENDGFSEVKRERGGRGRGGRGGRGFEGRGRGRGGRGEFRGHRGGRGRGGPRGASAAPAATTS